MSSVAGKNKTIPYGRQWIDEDDIAAVIDVLRGDMITQGSKIQEFENALAQYTGMKYAVVVNNGTSALHCTYLACGVEAGDEVIVPTLTFAATANSVCFINAKPILVDINPETFCVDIAQVEKAITNKTKAIAVVDFAGYPVDLSALRTLANKHGLKIIEDAAHALGARREGKHVGFLSDAVIFSFHPVKNITTGEGGAILTNDKKVYEQCLKLRTHGITRDVNEMSKVDGGWYYEMQTLGYNYRITDFQAALGIRQLSKNDSFLRRREEISRKYLTAFSGLGKYLVLPKIFNDQHVQHALHLFVVQFLESNLNANRKDIYDSYRNEGILTQVHYLPVHEHPYYQQTFGYKHGQFPSSEKYYTRCLSFPMFPKMTDDDVSRVIDVTMKVIEKFKK